MDRAEPLTAALEAALVRELNGAWHQVNGAFFRGALATPTLELVVTRSTLGRWVPQTRTIEISRHLVVETSWATVLEVLKHEVAHQYVHEVLRETSQTAHGPAFRDVCLRLGIDAYASGTPDAPKASQATHKTVERIARLLALAESPNRHEAEAAMAAAQRLMLKENLDAVSAAGTRTYGFEHLGRPTGRVLEHERLVAMILGRHFFIEAIWIPVYRPFEGKRGSVLEICGTPENLAIAGYVHGFLHQTAERLWREHQAARRIRSNRDRRSYLAGVMTGFADTLKRQEVKSQSEGLVWLGDGDLTRFHRRRHPHVRHVRHAGRPRSDAWSRGREAGRKIVLYRPVQGAATSHGLLLKAK
jgi:predicted SprT family Zn-dependent metalloprotease